MCIEVDSSEAHGLSMLRRFRMDGRAVEVVKVLDQRRRLLLLQGQRRRPRAVYPAARREPIRLDSRDVRKPGSSDSRATIRSQHAFQQGSRLTTYRLIAAAQPRNGGIAGVWAPKRILFRSARSNRKMG